MKYNNIFLCGEYIVEYLYTGPAYREMYKIIGYKNPFDIKLKIGTIIELSPYSVKPYTIEEPNLILKNIL